jgi:hypothetical protein
LLHAELDHASAAAGRPIHGDVERARVRLVNGTEAVQEVRRDHIERFPDAYHDARGAQA